MKSWYSLLLCLHLQSDTICEINRIIIFTENGWKFFWVGGFCHGLVGLQETIILFCPALSTASARLFDTPTNTIWTGKDFSLLFAALGKAVLLIPNIKVVGQTVQMSVTDRRQTLLSLALLSYTVDNKQCFNFEKGLKFRQVVVCRHCKMN